MASLNEEKEDQLFGLFTRVLTNMIVFFITDYMKAVAEENEEVSDSSEMGETQAYI